MSDLKVIFFFFLLSFLVCIRSLISSFIFASVTHVYVKR